jgi:alcohol dehydrogenase
MTSPFTFDFQPLTRILSGPGTLAKLGEVVRALGGQRILLVTDPGLEEAGHPQRAEQYLRQTGLGVMVFDGVEENPTTKHVGLGVEVARREKVDFIVAVGGGSAMDCAKGINFLLTNGGEMRDYWGVGKATRPMLPSVGVPTTAGTGSEAQSFALISDPVTHQKMACGDKKAAFKAAILDPELTLTQPARVAALTAMDAVTHSVEAHVSLKSSVLSRVFSREAWRLLERDFETALHSKDVNAWAAMQWGAHLAGLAIENAMLGAAHALANPLTAHYGMVHGQAVGMMLPRVIRYNAQHVAEGYLELARTAGLPAANGQQAAESLAARVEKLCTVAELPKSLGSQGVSDGMLMVLADEASQQWTSKFNPRPVGYQELLGLYRMAL